MGSPSINFDSVCLSGNTQKKKKNTTSKCLISFDIFCTWKKKARPVSEGGEDVVAVWVGGRGSDGGRRPRNCQVVTTQLFSYIIRDAVVRSTLRNS